MPVEVVRVDELGLELASVEEVSAVREARVLSVAEEAVLEPVIALEAVVPALEVAPVEEVPAV